MRKLTLGLFCAAGILTTNAYAVDTYLRYGGYNVDLPPQEEVSLRNPFFLNLSAQCTLNFSQESNEGTISVTLKNKSATVNDTTLDKDNNHFVFSIKHGDVMRIYAAAGAAVALKNESQDLIKASCSMG